MNARWQAKLMIAILVCGVAGAVSASEEVNRSYPLAAGSEVEIECLAGTLTIEGWDAEELEIVGTLGDGVEELDVNLNDGRVSIEVEYDEEYHGRASVATDLTVRMPAASSLSAETVSAAVTVSGLRGAVEVETVSGAIEISDAPESLEVETVSGKVEVAQAGDGSEVASVSGMIRIRSVNGRLDAENVSGSIVIEAGSLTGGDLETVSGDISCRALPGGQGDIDMETMNGTIELVVDEGAPASYQLETFSGSITSAIGPEPERTSKYTPEKQLRFNTGSGGPSISLSSFSGSIKLVAR